MIIDHRTYTLHPGKMPRFLEIYREKGYPVQSKHLGKPVGWFVSMDIGQLNQVVHMWAYDDLNQRAERRARMAADPAWQAYLAEATPLIQHMENKIVTAAPFFENPPAIPDVED